MMFFEARPGTPGEQEADVLTSAEEATNGN